MQAKRTW